MTNEQILQKIECRGTERGDDIVFEYEELRHATDDATLLHVEGEKIWIPHSQLVEHWPDSNEMQISQWIAELKGLA